MDIDSYEYRMATFYPFVPDVCAMLPKRWHSATKDKHLLLSRKNLCVQYNGPGKSVKEAGTVRGDVPVPPSCGVYYFEIKIENKGKNGYIGIGLNRGPTFKSNRLPGWDKDSYGYHGDDGHAFLSNTTGTPYGPTFGTDDVVGCGLNFVDKTVFFTKNGVCLGAPFTDVALTDTFYPVVGLQTPGECIVANFGQQEFVFDVCSYLDSTKKKVKDAVLNHPVLNSHGEWTRSMDSLVMSYLSHHGFAAAAEALAASSQIPLTESVADTRKRQYLVQLVLDGDLDGVLAALEPELLESQPTLHYQLCIQQFIEFIRNRQELDRVFALGRQLHSLQVKHNFDRDVFAKAVSLLAYREPSKSPLKSLLHPSHRTPAAEALNSALLAQKGHPSIPPLELSLAQAERCLHSLSHHLADGGPAFLYQLFQSPPELMPVSKTPLRLSQFRQSFNRDSS